MRYGALVCLLVALGACTAQAASDGGPSDVAVHDRQSFDEIARGRYLAIAGDCTACHTAPGGKPYAGGREIATPFGALVSPNLTPDRATGIGSWSDDDFVNAVRQGLGPGGQHLYPAMPYPYYTKMTRDEVLAIRAYLDTLEPVHNDVTSNQLPFPFDIRASMIAWNALFFTPGRFTPSPGKSAQWNRGAYLVEGPGHCGACHTAKNWLGADKTSRALQGGVLQGWFSPNLTGDPHTGLGAWSAEDVVTYLRTGHGRTAAATGPMAEVITDSTSKMKEADLAAIATYLKGTPPQGTAPAPVASNHPAMRAGEAIYVDECSACHGLSGTGVPNLFPALKGSPSVQSTDPTSLIRVVLEGTRSVATDPAPTAPAMPALGWKLSDAEVAGVVTYIRNSWGNAAAAVSPGDVKSERGDLAQAQP